MKGEIEMNEVKTTLVNYKYSAECPASKEMSLRINGEEVFVYDATSAYFANISFEGLLNIEVTTTRNIEKVVIHPIKHGIKADYDNHNISFIINEPMNLIIEVNNQLCPLFIFANPLENDIPSSEDPNVLYFRAGQIYEAGRLQLKDNQTLYIEGGAVVKGLVRAVNADNVKVLGRGIVDGGLLSLKDEIKQFLMVFEACRNLTIEGITLINPASWMLVLGACDGVNIKNTKEIGYVTSSDGIDVVGCTNVVIDGAFICNDDDRIAIKALDLRHQIGNATISWIRNVDSILIKNCVLFCTENCGGHAIDIGYELRSEYVQNIIYENLDIVAVHNFGSAFGIHNGDRAIVRKVHYKNIRLEHFYDRLVDIRIVNSMWSRDEERGQIRDIYFENIFANVEIYNEGYSHSIIGGYSSDNTVENVTFENFCVGSKRAKTKEDIWLYTSNAYNIEIK